MLWKGKIWLAVVGRYLPIKLSRGKVTHDAKLSHVNSVKSAGNGVRLPFFISFFFYYSFCTKLSEITRINFRNYRPLLFDIKRYIYCKKGNKNPHYQIIFKLKMSTIHSDLSLNTVSGLWRLFVNNAKMNTPTFETAVYTITISHDNFSPTQIFVVQ